MNTHTLFLGAAIITVLNCTSVHAQVLGGNIGGAAGGTLSGGMRDTGVLSRGSAAGSLGADFDTGSLHRTTRDAADRNTGRVRNTADAARQRAEAAAGSAHHTSANLAASTAATATHALNAQQIETATHVAGSTASAVSANGTQPSGAAAGMANQDALIKPELASPAGADALPASNVPETGAVKRAPSHENHLVSRAGPGQFAGTEERAASSRSLTTGAGLNGNANSNDTIGRATDDARMGVTGDASGSASGDVSASRNGVASQTSAQGSGSADVAVNR